METLGLSATGDAGRYRWETVTPSDSDYLSPPDRLIRVVAERLRWKHPLDEARRRAQEAPGGGEVCSLMEKVGVPASVIAAWAGHYSGAFTMSQYVHANPDDLAASRDALAANYRPEDAL
jgi:hypothetical protein